MVDQKGNKLEEGDMLVSTYTGEKITVLKIDNDQIHLCSYQRGNYWLSQASLLKSAWNKYL